MAYVVGLSSILQAGSGPCSQGNVETETLMSAQVELTEAEQSDLLTDGRFRRASLPKRRLTFVSEEDAGVTGLSGAQPCSGEPVADGGGGGEPLGGFRTASWDALARWDEAGSRRGSERDLLEALLGSAVGSGDDAPAAPPRQDAVGVLVRRWAEAIGSAQPATGLGAPPTRGLSQGCATDVHPGRGQPPPSMDAGGNAVLGAPHVRRLASLLTAAPAASQALLPMLTNTGALSLGQAAAHQVRQGHHSVMSACVSRARPAARLQGPRSPLWWSMACALAKAEAPVFAPANCTTLWGQHTRVNR